jgi:hypothetical protein
MSDTSKYESFLNDYLSQTSQMATPPPRQRAEVPTLPTNAPDKAASAFVPDTKAHRIPPRMNEVVNRYDSRHSYEDVEISELPMGEFYHPGTRIMFRDLKVKEIENYSSLDERSIFDFKEKLNEILTECIVFLHPDGTQGTALDLKDGDRAWLIYMIREKTFPKGRVLTVDVDYKTSAGEQKSTKIELIRANMDIHRGGEIMEYFNPKKRCLVFETTLRDESFNLAPPTIGLRRCFDHYLKIKAQNKEEEIPYAFYQIAPFMKPHVTYMDYDELAEMEHWFTQVLTPDEFSFLHDLITNHMKLGIRGLKKKVGTQLVTGDSVYPDRLASLFLLPNAFQLFLRK